VWRDARVCSGDEVSELIDAHAAVAGQARALFLLLLRLTTLAALSAERVLEVKGQHKEEEEPE